MSNVGHFQIFIYATMQLNIYIKYIFYRYYSLGSWEDINKNTDVVCITLR